MYNIAANVCEYEFYEIRYLLDVSRIFVDGKTFDVLIFPSEITEETAIQNKNIYQSLYEIFMFLMTDAKVINTFVVRFDDFQSFPEVVNILRRIALSTENSDLIENIAALNSENKEVMLEKITIEEIKIELSRQLNFNSLLENPN